MGGEHRKKQKYNNAHTHTHTLVFLTRFDFNDMTTIHKEMIFSNGVIVVVVLNL